MNRQWRMPPQATRARNVVSCLLGFESKEQADAADDDAGDGTQRLLTPIPRIITNTDEIGEQRHN